MNVLLFSAADKVDQHTISVSDERLTHLLTVHGAATGDELRVGEINGLMGTGIITAISQEQATLTVDLAEQPPAKLPVTLVLALPRPKMLRRILRSVAELGVDELHLINSYRVEKSYWQTPVLNDETVERYLLQGLSQARDTKLPTVSCHRRFKPFVQDELPALVGTRQALVFHPDEHADSLNSTTPAIDNNGVGKPGEHKPGVNKPEEHNTHSQVLVVGPEGGFIPYEVELFQAAGCQPITLGPRILRVENAVNVILGHFLVGRTAKP